MKMDHFIYSRLVNFKKEKRLFGKIGMYELNKKYELEIDNLDDLKKYKSNYFIFGCDCLNDWVSKFGNFAGSILTPVFLTFISISSLTSASLQTKLANLSKEPTFLKSL